MPQRKVEENFDDFQKFVDAKMDKIVLKLQFFMTILSKILIIFENRLDLMRSEYCELDTRLRKEGAADKAQVEAKNISDIIKNVKCKIKNVNLRPKIYILLTNCRRNTNLHNFILY